MDGDPRLQPRRELTGPGLPRTLQPGRFGLRFEDKSESELAELASHALRSASLKESDRMAQKVTYWITTGLVVAGSLFAAYSYLSGNQQAVNGFAHVGYPQQLRILLGIVKPLGAIALVIPGWPRLKEWAYAGFTFAWVAAFFAHYLAGDGAEAFLPVVLLFLLAVSYVTRPAARTWAPKGAAG